MLPLICVTIVAFTIKLLLLLCVNYGAVTVCDKCCQCWGVFFADLCVNAVATVCKCCCHCMNVEMLPLHCCSVNVIVTECNIAGVPVVLVTVQ